MAILWADGFEDWTSVTGEYETVDGTPTVVAQGRRSGKAMQLGANAVQKTLPSALTEVFASIALQPTSSTTGDVISFNSASTIQIIIAGAADGSLGAYRGATLLGSTPGGSISAGSYTHIQVRVVISDTVGVVQIRLNGSTSPSLNLTGIDTNNGAAAVSVDSVKLGRRPAGASRAGYYDDFVIWDTSGSIANTWIGDTRVDSYFPNANGDSSQFVGSDGNSTDNYLLVDAAAPNGTDYVQSDVVSNKDLYQFGNLSHTPSSIFGVLATAAALKDDAGTRDVRLLVKTGTTEVEGATTALSTSRARITHLFETDPTTSAAWTKSGIDGAQFGIKVQA